MTILKEGQAGLPSRNPTKSYWHKDPSKILLGHRSTPDLPTTADVVIVGSGISGSFAAHFLKHGCSPHQSVVMLEAREACWGATGRNGGHCQPLLYTSSAEVARFELQNYHFLKNFIAEHKIPCDWKSLTGCHVYLDDDTWQAATQAVARMDDAELRAQVSVVDPKLGGQSGLVELGIPSAKGAILQRNAASFWPYKLVCYILEKLLAEFPAARFNLQTNTPVTSLKYQEDAEPEWPSAESPDEAAGYYPWLLTTPRGTVAASRVLLCTNGYTSRLLPEFTDLIVPVRGQVGALCPPRDKPIRRLDHSFVFIGHGTQLDRDDYLIERPVTAEGRTGDLIYGGGRDKAPNLALGEWRDNTIDLNVASYLRQNLSPPLCLGGITRPNTRHDYTTKMDLAASFEWTGIMGYSRDKHPWVGRVPASLGGSDADPWYVEDEGLFICGGFTGHGMPVAALSARIVVNMMTRSHLRSQGLPQEFFIHKDRLRRVRETKSHLDSWATTLRDMLVRPC